jgi:uncharacterized protein YdeI (YjbR/CyaY-like superfamily)
MVEVCFRGYQHPMDVTKTLYVTQREAWRKWLDENYQSEPEIWLVGYRKQAGMPNLPYNAAVEEALCFGWIDSIRKNLDSERYAQRFSPRKRSTPYSQTNKERLKKLIEQGKVLPGVLETIDRHEIETFEFPDDILAALQANAQAWENFQKYSGSYQRIRVAYIEARRDQPEELKKRLEHLIHMTEQDKQFGYDIDTYY